MPPPTAEAQPVLQLDHDELTDLVQPLTRIDEFLRSDDAIARQRLSAGSSSPRAARRYPGGVILGDDPRTADTQVSTISAAGTQGLTAVADIRHADTLISGFSPISRQTVPPGTGRQAVRFGRENMIAGILLGRAPRTLSSQHARAWATSLLQTQLLPWKEIEEDGWHTTSGLLVQQYALFPDRDWILLGGVVRAPRPRAATDAYMLTWAEEALGLADPPAWLPGPEHDGTWYAALPDKKP